MSKILKEIKPVESGIVVVPTGEIDLQTAPQLYRELKEVCESKPQRLVVDLHDVTYMDSSGVSTLVEMYRCVSGYGGKLVLLSPNERVRGMFEIAKLDQFFTIRDDEREALSDE